MIPEQAPKTSGTVDPQRVLELIEQLGPMPVDEAKAYLVRAIALIEERQQARQAVILTSLPALPSGALATGTSDLTTLRRMVELLEAEPRPALSAPVAEVEPKPSTQPTSLAPESNGLFVPSRDLRPLMVGLGLLMVPLAIFVGVGRGERGPSAPVAAQRTRVPPAVVSTPIAHPVALEGAAPRASAGLGAKGAPAATSSADLAAPVALLRSPVPATGTRRVATPLRGPPEPAAHLEAKAAPRPSDVRRPPAGSPSPALPVEQDPFSSRR